MPIPLEKIKVVEHEIDRLNHEDKYLHNTITPPEQDFSFLNKSTHNKRTVHYDIEPISDNESQPLKFTSKISQPPTIENVLRRRYIAHWGLPGKCQRKEFFSPSIFFIEWLGDNHFLLQKHRPPANSVRECLISIASIHSETVNIWTHLIGALCVAVTYILFIIDNYQQMDLSDMISFSVFFISAILCLTFSTLLHVFINYSPRVLVTVSKLDYMGR